MNLPEDHILEEEPTEWEYEWFLETGDTEASLTLPKDEWDAISLNYTSGTTGNPKGVVYHHRGAYLNSLGNVISWNMGNYPTYLWTLPVINKNKGVYVFCRCFIVMGGVSHGPLVQ